MNLHETLREWNYLNSYGNEIILIVGERNYMNFREMKLKESLKEWNYMNRSWNWNYMKSCWNEILWIFGGKMKLYESLRKMELYESTGKEIKWLLEWMKLYESLKKEITWVSGGYEII